MNFYKNSFKQNVIDIPRSHRVAILKLGFIYYSIGNSSLAEECILNSSHKTDDPEIMLAAAAYYLFKEDPELDTGMAYLDLACKLQSNMSANITTRCETMLDLFLIRSETLYFRDTLEFYFEKWAQLRR